MRASAILAPAAVGIAYFAAGRLGLGLAAIHPSASAVWAPTGIAIAAVLLLGRRAAWPVFVAAFFVNWTTSGSLPASALIAAGNTGEALLAALLLERRGGHKALGEPRGILSFALAAGLASLLSASVGVTALYFAGLADAASAPAIWLTWWLGDATGALLFAPPIVLWARSPAPRLDPRAMGHAALLVSLVVLVGVVVFDGLMSDRLRGADLSFLPILFVVWMSFQYTPRTVSTAVLALSAIAIWSTLHGDRPFAFEPPSGDLLYLQLLAAALALAGLLISTVLQERRAIETALRTGERALRDRVRAHAENLAESVRALQNEVDQRRLAERRLMESQGRLEVAASLGGLGAWEWDMEEDRVTWSDELYRLFGQQPGNERASYQKYLSFLPADERARVDEAVHAALREKRPFRFEHSVVWPDGSVHHILGLGNVIVDEAGRPTKIVGTAQDVTEQRSSMMALREASIARSFVQRLVRNIILTGEVPERAVREVGRKLGAEMDGGGIDSAIREFRTLGLGHLWVGSSNGNVVTFDGDDLVERVPNSKQPTCFMTLSFLESVVARAERARALGTETSCQSRGHPRCHFVIRIDRAPPSASPRSAAARASKLTATRS